MCVNVAGEAAVKERVTPEVSLSHSNADEAVGHCAVAALVTGRGPRISYLISHIFAHAAGADASRKLDSTKH